MTGAEPDIVPAHGSDPDAAWLAAVGADAARDSGAPAELLGAFLTLLADAALTGRRPRQRDLSAVRELGRQAAGQNVSARQMAHLYLAAAAQLWSTVPAEVRTRGRDAVSAAAEAVLLVLEDAVAAMVDGHDLERRQMIRHEESERRQFIDDLLRGDSDVAALVERAEAFGLDLGRKHQVVLAAPSGRLVDELALEAALERSIVDRYADRSVLVISVDGQFVVIARADSIAANDDIGAVVNAVLAGLRKGGKWRIAAGRVHPGAYGVARSYEEARDALQLVASLHLDPPVAYARDLLVYRVLVRNQAALSDLVQAVLTPLTRAQGGAEPLLETLQTYFSAGGVATLTARRMHLSVRAVTYRLAKVAELTGYDPTDPASQLSLHVAVLGARLLGWPAKDLPPAG